MPRFDGILDGLCGFGGRFRQRFRNWFRGSSEAFGYERSHLSSSGDPRIDLLRRKSCDVAEVHLIHLFHSFIRVPAIATNAGRNPACLVLAAFFGSKESSPEETCSRTDFLILRPATQASGPPDLRIDHIESQYWAGQTSPSEPWLQSTTCNCTHLLAVFKRRGGPRGNTGPLRNSALFLTKSPRPDSNPKSQIPNPKSQIGKRQSQIGNAAPPGKKSGLEGFPFEAVCQCRWRCSCQLRSSSLRFRAGGWEFQRRDGAGGFCQNGRHACQLLVGEFRENRQ